MPGPILGCAVLADTMDASKRDDVEHEVPCHTPWPPLARGAGHHAQLPASIGRRPGGPQLPVILSPRLSASPHPPGLSGAGARPDGSEGAPLGQPSG